MARKRRELVPPRRITKNRMIIIAALAAVASTAGYFGISSITANGSTPVFGFPSNHFIKATHSANSGYEYISQSSGSVKGLRSNGGGGIINPTYTFSKGGLESIHFINED